MGFASILLATSIGETAATPAVVTTPATDTSARKSPQDPLEAEISDLGEAGVVGTELSPEVQNLENTLESGNALDEPSIVQEAPSQTDKLVGAITNLGQAFNTTNADMTGCSYAAEGTGAYAQTLCWLNFDGFTTEYKNSNELVMDKGNPVPRTAKVAKTADNRTALWGSVEDYPVRADLGGGYILHAELDVSAGSNTAKPVEGHHLPTWGSAFLGNSVGGDAFYTNIAGKPALYQMQNAGTSTITLKNIQMLKDDQPIFDYSIVVADAETTDATEKIEWSTNGAGFEWLPNDPAGNVTRQNYMGNACDSAYSPALTGKSQSASCVARSSNTKVGTPMLATTPQTGSDDFKISQVLSGNGRQGVAFGVITARAAVQTKVTDRIVNENDDAADLTNFVGTIFQSSTEIAKAETTSFAEESLQAASSLPVSSSGTQLQFESEAYGKLSDSYTSAWQCRKTDPDTGSETLWPALGGESDSAPPADFTLLQVGQFLECSIVYTPPYLTLEKEVDNAGTEAANTAEDFVLRAEGQKVGEWSSAFEGQGALDANAVAVMEKRAVAVGEYALSEESPATGIDGNWSHGYDWTELVCEADPVTEGFDSSKLTVEKDNDLVSSATLKVAQGDDITCRFKNVAREPRLESSKEAFNVDGEKIAWGTPINPGDVVSYKLGFTNSGTAPMLLNYVDHLGDVLDDATFEDGSIKISDGEEKTTYPMEDMNDPGVSVEEKLAESQPVLAISGEVDKGQTRTVWFRVEVMQNAEESAARQKGFDRNSDDQQPNRIGYMLNNYLRPEGEAVPLECEKPAEGEVSSCTSHPVPAWAVSKDSRPADGARLHKGGNTHYQITAHKMNSATHIEELVFEDDLTHVFKTAGWAPDAAVPGGALKRGIYFFNDAGQSLDENGNSNGTASAPVPAYDVPAPTFNDETNRWTITSEPVTLPENAMRAEMWFAVEAGQRPANIPPSWPGNTAPEFGSMYANYVRANSTNLEPNQCSMNGGKPVTSQDATRPRDHVGQYVFNDGTFPSECQVMHQMSDNYFTIRKDATGAGISAHDEKWGDPTGLTNMVGHKFEIRDDTGEGEWNSPSEEPSKFLCREKYKPENNWDGSFSYGGKPDWDQESETLASIIKHNNQFDDGDEQRLPLCALFYAQGTYGTVPMPHAGGQNGRWRSEYLIEGKYWLVETKAPTKQITNTGIEERDVPGVQLLAEPIGFQVWPSEDGLSFGPESPQQSMEGRGQLDIKGAEQQRCDPGVGVGDRPVACVNPTGYLMVVQDVVPLAMPFTGGGGPLLLLGGGGVILLSALGGSWLWLRSRRGERDM